jgi:hypothetical protein
MPRISQVTKRTRAASIVSGIRKRLPSAETYKMSGKAYTHEELAAFFQAQVDALDAVHAARAALAAAIAKERAVARSVAARLPLFQNSIGNRLGFTPEVFADFGWQLPKKPGPKTTASKLAGVERARATREARGTMGKKQRLKIRGW